MKQKKYHIYLSDMEYRHIIESLINMKNDLHTQGRYTDAIDDVLCKLLATKKKRVVINIV